MLLQLGLSTILVETFNVYKNNHSVVNISNIIAVGIFQVFLITQVCT
jgi:hypothetical protein